MYENAIWPPKPSKPPKPRLNEGLVIRYGHTHLVVVRAIQGLEKRDYHDALRLFEINNDGRLVSYNRWNDLPAMDTIEYKFCTAIWRTVADFVADMDRDTGKNSSVGTSEVSKLLDDAGRHIECDTLERSDVQAFLKMLRKAINTSAR